MNRIPNCHTLNCGKRGILLIASHRTAHYILQKSRKGSWESGVYYQVEPIWISEHFAMVGICPYLGICLIIYIKGEN